MPYTSPSSNGVSTPNNLPLQHTPFIGRGNEISALISLLNRPTSRLVTMTGPGGTGKTRLATQIGSALLGVGGDPVSAEATFRQGIFFVNLAPINDPGLVATTIAQALSLTEVGDQTAFERLKEHLSDKEMLLILDNFEQVLEAAPLISDLISAAPHIKALVTSRTVLNLRGEKEFAVPPMQLPDRNHLPQIETLSQYDGVSLFIQRAVEVKPDFVVTNENAPAVAEICHRLDGLPLAIELAAARSKMLTPQAMLVRLASRLKLLTGGARDLPARQQTLRNAIEWSYDLLEPPEQALFRRMSVFSGGRTLEAIEAVCNPDDDLSIDVLDGVESLLNKSLLQRRGDARQEPRFWMLETIHEYAREKLEESGEWEKFAREHAIYFLRLAEEAEPHLTGEKQVEWLNLVEYEHDNFRAALNWARKQAERMYPEAAEIGLRTAGAISGFWIVRGYFSEGRDKLQGLLSSASASGYPSSSPGSKVKALVALGSLALQQGDYPRSRNALEQAISIAREVEDKKSMGSALRLLGYVSMEQGDSDVARTLLEESLSMARELGDKRAIAGSLPSLATLSGLQEDYDAARMLLEESLVIARQLGDKRVVSSSLFSLATLSQLQGDYDAARMLLEESLVIARQLGHKRGISGSLFSLATLSQLQGDYDVARSLFEESLTIIRELGHKRVIAGTLGNLGNLFYLQKDYSTAQSLHKESFVINIELGDKRNMPVNLVGLGGVAAGMGQPQRGAMLIGAAQALLEAIGATLDRVDRIPYERALASVRAQLGEEEYKKALQEGRALSMKQVIEYALQYEPETKVAVEKHQQPTPISPTPEHKATIPTRYPAGLTKREVQVLCLLTQGLTYEEIGAKLVISSRTVDTHLTHIYNKLDVKSRSAAMLFAIEQKLCE